MANFDFIFQAVSKTTHASEIKALLGLNKPQKVLISVAFVTEDGVAAIESALNSNAGISNIFVGIRNGITSSQALLRLLKNCKNLYAVDTGSRDVIFHPKLYLAFNKLEACLIVGSANMTFGGLHNNIEASTKLTINLKDKAEKAFVDKLVGMFAKLPSSHPEHVFKIESRKQIRELLDAGLLIDETAVSSPPKSLPVAKSKLEGLARMSLHRVPKPAPKKKLAKAAAVAAAHTAKNLSKASGASAASFANFQLVWQSKPLSERDLNVPTGKNTNSTGSMLWKKGTMDGIDQRHYFRDKVFAGLDWTTDTKTPHYERATATFELVISNVNCGKFLLRLSHNTNTGSRSYKQSNAMTSVSWGSARKLIANPNLLGRHLNLYRNESDIREFIIEID